MRLRVECYAGHHGDETPRALAIGGRRIEIIEILDRWLAPAYRYFKLRGEDRDTYVLPARRRVGYLGVDDVRTDPSSSSSSSDVAASGDGKGSNDGRYGRSGEGPASR
jgi:hypothetical protein